MATPETETPIESLNRSAIVTQANWIYSKRTAGFHYGSKRPIPYLKSAHTLPLTTDCSGFVILCYAWSNPTAACDPSGNGYNGSGSSTSFFNHCQHISRSSLLTGDIVVFGANGANHAILTLGAGSDPQCMSHGREGQPAKNSLSQMLTWGLGSPTYLRGI
jgi:hypothetical protein